MGLFDKLLSITRKDTNPNHSLNVIDSKSIMDEERFWDIILIAKIKSFGDYQRHHEVLTEELLKLSFDELISFDQMFNFFKIKANTKALSNALYSITGNHDNDYLNTFRIWMIGQGQHFFYKTIKRPETLKELEIEFLDELNAFEGLAFIPSILIQKKTNENKQEQFQENLIFKEYQKRKDTNTLKNILLQIQSKYSYII